MRIRQTKSGLIFFLLLFLATSTRLQAEDCTKVLIDIGRFVCSYGEGNIFDVPKDKPAFLPNKNELDKFYFDSVEDLQQNNKIRAIYRNSDRETNGPFQYCNDSYGCRFIKDGGDEILDKVEHAKAESEIQRIKASYATRKSQLLNDAKQASTIHSEKQVKSSIAGSAYREQIKNITGSVKADLPEIKSRTVETKAKNEQYSKTDIPARQKALEERREGSKKMVADANEDLTRESAEIAAGLSELNEGMEATEKGRESLVKAVSDVTRSSSAPVIEPENVAATLHEQGQAYYAEGLPIQGQRLLDRAVTYENYKAGATLPYQGVALSDKARELYDSNASPETFYGYQNVLLLNAFASSDRIVNNEEGLGTFTKALALQLEQQVLTPQAEIGTFLNLLDQGWGVVDYAKGLSIGVLKGSYDAWSGIYTIVNEPYSAPLGIYYAFKNFDMVSQAVGRKLLESYDVLQNCSQKPRECGELKGHLAIDIASIFFGSELGKTEKLIDATNDAARMVGDDVAKLAEKAAEIGIKDADDLKAFAKLVGADCLLGRAETRRPSWELFLGIGTAYAEVPCRFSTLSDLVTSLSKTPSGLNVSWILDAKGIFNKVKALKDRIPNDSYNTLLSRMETTVRETESMAKAWADRRVTNPDILKSKFNGGALAEGEALSQVLTKADVEVVELGRVVKSIDGSDATEIDMITLEKGMTWLSEVKSNVKKWERAPMEAYLGHANSLPNSGIRFYYENHSASYLENVSAFFRSHGYSAEKGNFELVPLRGRKE